MHIYHLFVGKQSPWYADLQNIRIEINFNIDITKYDY